MASGRDWCRSSTNCAINIAPRRGAA